MLLKTTITNASALGRGLLVGIVGTLLCTSAIASETVLYSFQGGNDGHVPMSGLVSDAAGNMYGTTLVGGGNGCDCGVVFRLSASGQESVLHAFAQVKDGAFPYAGLTIDAAGNLYGTTTAGGGKGKGCIGGQGCGTVFEIASNGTESVIHTFTGKKTDGWNPEGGLLLDNKGNLYGTTTVGGNPNGGGGTAFRIAPTGHKKALFEFDQDSGEFPSGTLIRDSHGDLFGTTQSGGPVLGVVFKLARDGKETVIHNFTGGSDGDTPVAGLITDTAGNFYGTTYYGGGGTGCSSNRGCGTVFKVTPDGTESVLYAFQGGNDGAFPTAPLVADTNGNLYGTTYAGGPTCLGNAGCGIVFKIAPNGAETILYTFCSLANCTDGGQPYGGLLIDENGVLYGTTTGGGANQDGVVFSVTTQ